MGIFAATKQDGDLNFVLVLEKADSFFDFELNVVFIGCLAESEPL